MVQEGYQRGPVHIGKMVMNMRAYRWTQNDVDNYKKLKEKETLMLLGGVSPAIEEAMNSLGDELDKYLNEAKGIKEEEKDKKSKKEDKSVWETMFGDFYTPAKKSGKKSDGDESGKDKAREEFKKEKPKDAFTACWAIYNNFKKAHQMITW